MISAICPVYNTDTELLRKTVQTVLDQSFREFELLLVDDGSKKEVADYLDGLSKLDERITVYHIKNGGVSNARNFGMLKAKGEYITFLDSDDCIADCFFEHAYRAACENDADIVMGFIKRVRLGLESEINLSDNLQFEECKIDNFTGQSKDEVVVSLFGSKKGKNGYKLHTGCCGKLYKKAILNGLVFDTGLKYNEDNLFVRSAVRRANTITVCREVWYYYLQNMLSAMNAASGRLEIYCHNIRKFWDCLWEINKEESDYVIKYSRVNAVDLYTIFVYTALISADIGLSRKLDKMREFIAHPLIDDAVSNLYCKDSSLSYGERAKLFLMKRKSLRLLYMFSVIWKRVNPW